MPEGVDSGWRDVEADGGSGFADVFEAECGSQGKSDDAGDGRTDRQNDALLQGVGGGHGFSLQLSVLSSQLSASGDDAALSGLSEN